jgi:hypothetical protein
MSLDPVDLVPPFRSLMPRLLPPGDARLRYIPGPLAEGMVRVVLNSASYEEPADFELYDPANLIHLVIEPQRVFDLPVDRYERWRVVKAAAADVEEEIESLISTRSGEIAAHRQR